MARADDGRDSGPGAHAGASDARLTELLRADTVTAYPALQELRSRHHAAVLAYARLCTPNASTARQLAAQAFALAARRTARGVDPGLPWRHHLLLLTARVAGTWSQDGRAAGLDAGLLLVLSTAGPSGPVPPMLTAFQTLPSRTQGLIWYGVVDREPVEQTAALLGLTRADVTYGTAPALQQLARACLRTRLAASDDPDCPDFGRLIEESVRPDSPRDSADLHAHMARCPHCTTAYEELSALRDAPRTALAEGLLPWGGAAYGAGFAGERTAVGLVADDRWTRRAWTRRAWTRGVWPGDRGRFVLVSAALGVALLPLVAFLVAQGGASSTQDPVGSVGTPVSAPTVAVTVTATVTPTPTPSKSSTSPSPSPSPSRSSKSPSATKSPTPTRTARPKPPPSPTHPPGGAYAQVVNVGSGLCLDIDGAPENGTDVVTATCTSSRDQRWRFDSARGVLQSYAHPDYCLDSRGSVYRGVGIWTCDSVYGRNGWNLMFMVDSQGVIRPGIAPDHALTPSDDKSLVLVRDAGRESQRWRAGAV